MWSINHIYQVILFIYFFSLQRAIDKGCWLREQKKYLLCPQIKLISGDVQASPLFGSSQSSSSAPSPPNLAAHCYPLSALWWRKHRKNRLCQKVPSLLCPLKDNQQKIWNYQNNSVYLQRNWKIGGIYDSINMGEPPRRGEEISGEEEVRSLWQNPGNCDMWEIWCIYEIRWDFW